MFIRTLHISSKRINTALSKVRNLSTLDRRSVAGGNNKMPDEKRNAVVKHINQFPRYKSHYCRVKKLDQEYLQEGTTLPLMYKLYKTENSVPVSFSSYKRIFLNDFNLKLKKPKKDTCNKCDTFSAKIGNLLEGEEKTQVQNEHNLHLEEAKTARAAMNLDLFEAANNKNTETLTYDMQKTLPYLA